MRVKIGRGAVLVLLTGSRNGFADFGVGREAVVAADLQSLAGVHEENVKGEKGGDWRRNVKGEKGGDWRRSLFAEVRGWSKLFLKRDPTLKMKMNKIEQKWVILFGGSGRVGSG
ncbi:hypothetical protein KY285_036681 [Solanum tuberosum]|nr:hypothetical protein KY285_036681 [Solanum tuberosum]